MTVQMLIWLLEELPRDANVYIEDGDGIVSLIDTIESEARLERRNCTGFELSDKSLLEEAAVVICTRR